MSSRPPQEAISVKPWLESKKSRSIRRRMPFPDSFLETARSLELLGLLTVYTRANGWRWEAAVCFPAGRERWLKPHRTLDGILELHVIDQNGDDLDADVDREHCQGDEADELEAAGAPLRSACRKPLLASQETMPIALPGACKASESP